MSHTHIRMKNQLRDAWGLMDDGFVCLYFLVLFLLCTAVVTVLMSSLTDRLRTAKNIQKLNLYLAQESAVLQYVKCQLINEQLQDGSYEENGVSFDLSLHGDRIDISIHAPSPELLQITLEDETHVYDYDVVRSETAA